MIKNISLIISLVVVLGGGFLAFGQLTANQENTKETVIELKEDAKESKKKIIEIEMINLEQSIVQERVVGLLDKLESKLEK